jgi:soluble lytic murein transglycosylase
MAFAIVSVLGIVLQVDAAGGGPDQKADAMPADPATLATIKGAIALARKGEPAQASDVKESISDPVARKVIEWAILCSDNNEVDFQRYVAFISDNPGWPNIGLLRRRAEAALWKERLDPPTVRISRRSLGARPGRATPASSRTTAPRTTSPERETSSLLLFDGASRDAADEAIEEKIVRDRYRDARDQRRAHQFAPVKDVAANEVGCDPQGDGLFLR